MRTCRKPNSDAPASADGDARHDQLLDAQAPQDLARVGRPLAGQVCEERIPEDAPDHAGVLGGPLLGGRKAVQPGREDGLDRRRDLDLLHRPCQLPGLVHEAHDAAVHEHAHQLLGEERVARRQGSRRGRAARAAGRRRGDHRPSGRSRRRRAARGRSRRRWGCRRPTRRRRSSSSWRARQRTRIGPSAQRARNSRKSSRPSSAQWMSSCTRTSGLSRGERLEVPAPRVVERVAPDALVRADGQQRGQGPGDRARHQRYRAPSCGPRAWPAPSPERRRRGSWRRP